MYPFAKLKEPDEMSMSASLSHLRNYYHFQIFYLTTKLDYLNASKAQPWDKEEIENQLTHVKQQLESLYDYS